MSRVPVLSLEGVGLTYFRGGRHRIALLSDVSFEVAAGEFVAIVGDPLSGKTTLLQIAAGLIPPAGGTVRLDGNPLPVTDDLDQRIAIADRLSPPLEMLGMSVLDTVAVPLYGPTLPREVAEQRAADALAVFEIPDLNRARWSELSNVERMLVRVAQATVRRPRLLLVDEPMLGLNIAHSVAVASLLTDAAENGAAVVMTAGHRDQADYARSTLMLTAGSIEPPEPGGRLLDFPTTGT
jgi:ABC-type cobalamin/Fe3+-siderophores transport system ATPase subunit